MSMETGDRLPWRADATPLMLAPMQGLTNRALRAVFGETARPDVLFTEFVRVRPTSPVPIADSDFTEATTTVGSIPLVVQVIGSPDEGTVDATRELVARGVRHINVNMGCPWGRMTSVLAGGGMFRAPEAVAPFLKELRELVPGSLSVKTRAGLDDERQIFDVLPAFEAADIDFLVLHPRTVEQKYRGAANHALTREVVERSPFLVVANGDVREASDASRVLERTGAAGLMLGRGAIRDPRLFARIRGEAPARPTGDVLRRELASHLARLLDAFEPVFCGEAQILAKWRESLAHIDDDELTRWVKTLRKHKRVPTLREALADAAS